MTFAIALSPMVSFAEVRVNATSSNPVQTSEDVIKSNNDPSDKVANESSEKDKIGNSGEKSIHKQTESDKTYNKTISKETSNYVVSVSFDEKSKIPETATLFVKEIKENTKGYDYQKYISDVTDKIGELPLPLRFS